MEWYIKVIKQFNDFKTRARRKEYWMFTFFSIIISGILTLIDTNLGTEVNNGIGLFSGIYSLLVLVPSLAVQVRRLHDVGKSGWMLLVALIPIIGAIWLLILFCKEGQQQENKWGFNPKEI